MLKRKRFVLIIFTVLLSAALLASVGMTAAIWTSEGEGNTYTPEAPAYDWNFWQKYVICENIYGDKVDDKGQTRIVPENVIGVALTGFSDINYKEVIIPKQMPIIIDGKEIEGEFRNVIEIRSTLFMNASLKNMPEKIVIPPSVALIQSMAFSSLPNLNEVIFVNGENSEVCTAELLSFGFCPKLKNVNLNGRTVNFPENDGAFVGSDNKVIIK